MALLRDCTFAQAALDPTKLREHNYLFKELTTWSMPSGFLLLYKIA
jgi:hypothetical protein